MESKIKNQFTDYQPYTTLTTVQSLQPYPPFVSFFNPINKFQFQTSLYDFNNIFNQQLPLESSIKSHLSILPQIELVETPKKKKNYINKTIQKEVLSARKNSESNIINQFYSLFSNRELTQWILSKCIIQMGKKIIELQKIIRIFYKSIQYINWKRGRKYVNTAMLIQFYHPKSFLDYLSEVQDQFQSIGQFGIEEICELFRRSSKYFLSSMSLSAILTSKRISSLSKLQHLKRRRKILTNILEL